MGVIVVVVIVVAAAAASGPLSVSNLPSLPSVENPLMPDYFNLAPAVCQNDQGYLSTLYYVSTTLC